MTQYSAKLGAGALDGWSDGAGGTLTFKSVNGETVFPVTVSGLGAAGTASAVITKTGAGVIYDDAGDPANNPAHAVTASLTGIPVVVTNGTNDTAATLRLDLTGHTGGIWSVSGGAASITITSAPLVTVPVASGGAGSINITG